MDITCKITIILPVDVVGSDGDTMRFVPYRQYCYKEKIEYLIPCTDACDDKDLKKKTMGYVVEVMDQDFIINERNAMPAISDRDEDEQLTFPERVRKYLLVDSKARDYKKETLEILGHDVKAAEQTDYNGGWLQRALGETSDDSGL